jgi:LAO/AO transport system kinase
MSTLIDRISAGEAKAVARAISRVEDGAADSSDLMKECFCAGGQSVSCGNYGSPGAGKSTIVDKLAGFYRAQANASALLPLTRQVRFPAVQSSAIAFACRPCRSTRTYLFDQWQRAGILAAWRAGTVDAVAILDAAGYQKILVETVGVGQDEVEIVKTADVCVVVLVPGMGDDVQTMKAGIMEIGDVLV